MKTKKLNFDDFRENQLSSIGQKSIRGGDSIDSPLVDGEWNEDIDPITGVPPAGGVTVSSSGSIRIDDGSEPLRATVLIP